MNFIKFSQPQIFSRQQSIEERATDLQMLLPAYCMVPEKGRHYVKNIKKSETSERR